MIKFLLTIVLLGGAVFMFLGFTSEHYDSIQVMQAQKKELVAASEKMKVLNEVRGKLLEEYNAFTQEDLDRLKKALPDNVDNIRLIMDIDGIASKYDLSLRNVAVEITGNAPGVISSGEGEYGIATVTFSVACPYKTFLRFLADLEQSLRIIDVVSIAFSSDDTGVYAYTVSFKTYWLK